MTKLFFALGILASITGFILALCPAAGAQSMRRIQMDSKDGVAMLPEIGAIVLLEDGKCRVVAVSPAEARPAAYRTIDLQEGDVVAMANGKRLAKPAQLDSLYKAAAIGNEIKLGIERGAQMMIIKFAKADEKDLPRRQIKMIGGPDGEHSDTNVVRRHAELPKDVANMTPLVSAGIVLGDKNGKVVIVDVLGLPEADPRTKEFKEEDVLVSIDGQTVTDAASAEKAFARIGDGQDVAFVVERGGEQRTITFTRKATGAVIKMDGK